MTVGTWLAFAVGAGVGAPLRFLIDEAVKERKGGESPSGTLVVNAIGSLLLGIITALVIRDRIPDDVETVVGIGFTGALTTFSTFALHTVRLLEAGDVDAAFKNVATQTSTAIGLAAVGYATVLNVM